MRARVRWLELFYEEHFVLVVDRLLPSLIRKLKLRLAPASRRRVARTMTLILKPTDLGHGNLKDDYEVLWIETVRRMRGSCLDHFCRALIMEQNHGTKLGVGRGNPWTTK
jgi:hypothetical protein